MKRFLLTLFTLMLLISAASATINITAGPISQTAITWTWPVSVTATGIVSDGINVTDFNGASHSYVQSDLKPNETHSIYIVSATDSGSANATTLQDTGNTATTDFIPMLSTWGYLILIAVLCVIGMMRKLGIFCVVASAVSIYAMYAFISANTINTSNPYLEIPFLIYLTFFIVPLWLVLGVKGGIFK